MKSSYFLVKVNYRFANLCGATINVSEMYVLPQKRFIFTRARPPEGIISGAEIVSQFRVSRRETWTLLRGQPHQRPDVCHRGRRRRRRHPTDFISVASTEGFRKSHLCRVYLSGRRAAPKCTPKFLKKIYFPPIAPTRYFSPDISRVQCRVFLSAWPTSKRETLVIIIGLSRNRTRKERGRREKKKDKTARFVRDEDRKSISSASTQRLAARDRVSKLFFTTYIA